MSEFKKMLGDAFECNARKYVVTRETEKSFWLEKNGPFRKSSLSRDGSFYQRGVGWHSSFYRPMTEALEKKVYSKQLDYAFLKALDRVRATEDEELKQAVIDLINKWVNK